MKYASYKATGEEKIPAIIVKGEMQTPVWIQQLWDTGEYQLYVRKNGCGHCCAAMALRMHGVDIDPHSEYALCRRLWGAPRDEGERRQGNFQSVVGIAKIINHFGVPASYHGVPDAESAIAHILDCLEDGKIVIFESHPTEDYPDNPFSKGEHWVMAVGFTEDGGILVANSSNRLFGDGVQIVDADTIRRALYLGACPDDSMTYGEWRDEFIYGVGYVVVG